MKLKTKLVIVSLLMTAPLAAFADRWGAETEAGIPQCEAKAGEENTNHDNSDPSVCPKNVTTGDITKPAPAVQNNNINATGTKEVDPGTNGQSIGP